MKLFFRLTKFTIYLIILTALMHNVYAVYYDTLPKGVRVVSFKQISSGKINSKFTNDREENKFFLKQRFDSKSLEKLDDSLKKYMSELRLVSEEAYQEFSFGEYEAEAEAKVKANVLALAYGITDNLMVYIGVPYLYGEVNIDISRISENNHSRVQRILDRDNADENLTRIISELPDASEGLIQSAMVNYYGYNPIGNWYAEGLGDLEFGVTYRPTAWKRGGMAMSLGAVAPTGKGDNPDTLQDVAFGDEQWDFFGEFGGGVSFFNKSLFFETFARFTYQDKSKKILRIPESYDYPLSYRKGEFIEKRGNKLKASLGIAWKIRPWISLKSYYFYDYKDEDIYKSKYSLANKILGANSVEESDSVQLTLVLSSLNSFQKKRFPIPVEFLASSKKVISGKNIPNYSRVDFELRFFF